MITLLLSQQLSTVALIPFAGTQLPHFPFQIVIEQQSFGSEVAVEPSGIHVPHLLFHKDFVTQQLFASPLAGTIPSFEQVVGAGTGGAAEAAGGSEAGGGAEAGDDAALKMVEATDDINSVKVSAVVAGGDVVVGESGLFPGGVSIGSLHVEAV
jgi:hypothetical protein